MPTKKEPLFSNTDAFQELTFEEAIKELAIAQKTISEWQEIRDLTHLFFQIVCNYDIRTPLQFILAFSDIILQEKDGPLPEQLRHDLTLIHKKGQEIRRVIDTALYTLKAEQLKIGSQQDLPPVEVDLGEIKGIKFTEKDMVQLNVSTENLPNVLVDPDRLRMVVIDTASVLSKNFTEGKIILDVESNEDWATIRISNSEIILPDRFLEKFNQMATAPTLFASEYIGEILHLSISRFFIEMYGGVMKLTRDAEAGSVVTITLPICKNKG